jgi:hypothetical protein
MEDRVQIFMLFAYAVNDRADGVGDTARKHKTESDGTPALNGGGEIDGYAPSHSNVKDHRNLAEFFHINCGQHDCGDKQSPDKSKDDPRHFRVSVMNTDQCGGSVSSRNQKIYCAMVENLHHSFADAGRK